MRWMKPLAGILGSALLAIGATVGAQAAPAPESIVVGIDPTFPPFEVQRGDDISGFTIDLMNAIAKAENLKIRYRVMEYGGLIPSLQAGSIDAIASSMTIKQSRMQRADFTNAYYRAGLSVVVAKDSPITGFADLTGHVVATKKGTNSVDYLLNHGFDQSHLRLFQGADQYQALLSGSVDAVLFDNPRNLYFVQSHPDRAKIVGDLLTGDYYGIAVNKKKPALLERLNAGLAAIQANGEYAALFSKYFGGDMSGAVDGTKTPAEVALPE